MSFRNARRDELSINDRAPDDEGLLSYSQSFGTNPFFGSERQFRGESITGLKFTRAESV